MPAQLIGETPRVETRTLTDEQIAGYRDNGFLHLKGVLTAEEVERYRSAAARAYDEITSLDADNQMFRQIVQVWKSDADAARADPAPGTGRLRRPAGRDPMSGCGTTSC